MTLMGFTEALVLLRPKDSSSQGYIYISHAGFEEFSAFFVNYCGYIPPTFYASRNQVEWHVEVSVNHRGLVCHEVV